MNWCLKADVLKDTEFTFKICDQGLCLMLIHNKSQPQNGS